MTPPHPRTRQHLPPIVGQCLACPGRPLAPAVRQFFEHLLYHDLSGVQIHTDLHAARSARALQADAYAVAEHVVFGEGMYAPDTDWGLSLLAHELVHVVQHQLHGAREAGPLLSEPTDRAEQEAALLARLVFKGCTSLPAIRTGVQALIQRAPRGAIRVFWRGGSLREMPGKGSAKVGAHVHELGEGISFTDREDVAEQYAVLREPNNKANRYTMAIKVDLSKYRVLDLTTNQAWTAFIKRFFTDRGHDVKVLLKHQEAYRATVDMFLARQNDARENYDLIIGPEAIRDGNQLCIRYTLRTEALRGTIVQAWERLGSRGGAAASGARPGAPQTTPAARRGVGAPAPYKRVVGRGGVIVSAAKKAAGAPVDAAISTAAKAQRAISTQATKTTRTDSRPRFSAALKGAIAELIARAILWILSSIADHFMHKRVKEELEKLHKRQIEEALEQGRGVLIIVVYWVDDRPDEATGFVQRGVMYVTTLTADSEEQAIKKWKSTAKIQRPPKDAHEEDSYFWLDPGDALAQLKTK